MRRDFRIGVLKPLSVERHNLFIIDIMSHHNWDAFLSWAYTDLIYLLSQEMEEESQKPRINDIIQANPMILKELKTTVQQMTSKHLKSQLAPQLFVYYRTHPEIKNNPIYIHQHHQVLRLFQQQQEALTHKNEVPNWQPDGMIPVVSKSELRQSGKRKSIQTLIKLIRSIETYYTDNNEHRDNTQPQFIDLRNKKLTTELYKHLNHTLIENYNSHTDPQLRAAVNKLVIENTINRHTNFSKRVNRQEIKPYSQQAVKLTGLLESVEPEVSQNRHLVREKSPKTLRVKPAFKTLDPKDKQVLLEKMMRFYIKPQTNKTEEVSHTVHEVQKKLHHKRYDVGQYDVLQKLELLLIPAIEHTRKTYEGKALARISQTYRHELLSESKAINYKNSRSLSHKRTKATTEKEMQLALKQLLSSRKVSLSVDQENHRDTFATVLMTAQMRTALKQLQVNLQNKQQNLVLQTSVKDSHEKQFNLRTHALRTLLSEQRFKDQSINEHSFKEQGLKTHHDESHEQSHERFLSLKQLINSRNVVQVQHRKQNQNLHTLTTTQTRAALKELQTRLKYRTQSNITKSDTANSSVIANNEQQLKVYKKTLRTRHYAKSFEENHVKNEPATEQVTTTEREAFLALKYLLNSRKVVQRTEKAQSSNRLTTTQTQTELKQLQKKLQRETQSRVLRSRTQRHTKQNYSKAHLLTQVSSEAITEHEAFLALKQLLNSRKVSNYTNQSYNLHTLTTAQTQAVLKQLQTKLQRETQTRLLRSKAQNNTQSHTQNNTIENYDEAHRLIHVSSKETTEHEAFLALKQLLSSRNMSNHTNQAINLHTLTTAQTKKALKQLQTKLQRETQKSVLRRRTQNHTTQSHTTQSHTTKNYDKAHRLIHVSSKEVTEHEAFLALKQLLSSRNVSQHTGREIYLNTLTTAETKKALKQLQTRLQRETQTRLLRSRTQNSTQSNTQNNTQNNTIENYDKAYQLTHVRSEETTVHEAFLALKQLINSRRVMQHKSQEQTLNTMTTAKNLAALKQLQIKLQSRTQSRSNRIIQSDLTTDSVTHNHLTNNHLTNNHETHSQFNNDHMQQLTHMLTEETVAREAYLTLKELINSRKVVIQANQDHHINVLMTNQTRAALKQLQIRLHSRTQRNETKHNNIKEVEAVTHSLNRVESDLTHVKAELSNTHEAMLAFGQLFKNRKVVRQTNQAHRMNLLTTEQTRTALKLTHNLSHEQTEATTEQEAFIAIKQLINNRKVTQQTNQVNRLQQMTTAQTRTVLKQLLLKLQTKKTENQNMQSNEKLVNAIKTTTEEVSVLKQVQLNKPQLAFKQEVQVREIIREVIKDVTLENKKTTSSFETQNQLGGCETLQIQEVPNNATQSNSLKVQTAAINLDDVADQVIEKVMQKLERERRRRGM